MAQGASPEKQAQTLESAESQNLVVTQPEKFQGLLETITLMDRVSERIGEGNSGDWSGGGSGTGDDDSQGDDSSTSVRAQMIANLPTPTNMRKKLGGHIEKEIKQLQKEVNKKAAWAAKPGAAYQVNELYKKIRRLNALLSELMDASAEVLKRLFIRVFIDKQSI